MIDAQMPIRAPRIKYFEDSALQALHAGQSGSFPYPDADRLKRDREMSATLETVEKLRKALQEVKLARGALGATESAEEAGPSMQSTDLASASKRRGRAARAAAALGRQVKLSFDVAKLGIRPADHKPISAAVQTTEAIIAEHSQW